MSNKLKTTSSGKSIFILIVLILIIGVIFYFVYPSLNLKSQVKVKVGKDVVINVLESPYKELEVNEPFNFKIQLKNFNKRDIHGKICIIDTLPEHYNGPHDCMDVFLEPAQETPQQDIIPSETNIYFPSKEGSYSYIDAPADTVSISLKFDYETQTIATTQLCLKRQDITELPKGVTCPKVETLAIRQEPAPLKITSIEKELGSAGDRLKLKLRIKLKKTEEGIILNSKDLENYNPEQLFPLILEARLQEMPLKCAPPINPLDMENKEIEVLCTGEINLQQGHIVTQLNLNIPYGFKKTIPLGEIKLIKQEKTF